MKKKTVVEPKKSQPRRAAWTVQTFDDWRSRLTANDHVINLASPQAAQLRAARRKVLKVFVRKKRRPFSLDSINLDQDDPESWEYHG